MNVFVVAGAVLAVWAVLVALLGLRGFPKGRGGERIAIAITAVLVLGAVGAAVGDQTKVGERHGPHKATDEHEGGKEAQPEGEGQEQGGAAPGASSDEAPEQEQRDPAGAPADGDTTALSLEADPTGQLKFDKNSLEAPAGTVRITMTNPSPVPHNVALRGDGVDEKGEVVQGDAESTVEAEVQPGEYVFYCSVPGHEEGGMKGTLTVK